MRNLGMRDDNTFCEFLLNKALIAVVAARFGCPGHMRLSFACSMETLEKTIQRLRAVLPAQAQAKTA